ncbi:golgi transport complex component Cog5 [Ceratocystis lukuohia]|uniref:Golgi transport complex component Cog5 n=1 Tax=Ceratocystis lukuohia TaxID=2019550 RepID=A0ABR4MG86_9PEZI
MNNKKRSYVDYRTFLDPTFQPPAFIRDLVQSTGGSDDQQIDFSTPLARILFDIQEVNSDIDSVTTGSAGPLLSHTLGQNNASQSLTDGLDALTDALYRSHLHLEREVGITHDFAIMTQYVARRVTSTHSLLTSLSTFFKLSRQLEIHCLEFLPVGYSEPQAYPSLVHCAEIIISTESMTNRSSPDAVARSLGYIEIVNQIQDAVILPISSVVLQQSIRVIREFSVPESETFAQSEANKLRLASSFHALYFMSYSDFARCARPDRSFSSFSPLLLYKHITMYIRRTVDLSTHAFGDFLRQMTLPHNGISQIIKHGQNIMALEHVMSTCWPKKHEVLPGAPIESSYLTTYHKYIGSPSLIKLFWEVLTDKIRDQVAPIIIINPISQLTISSAIENFILTGSRMPDSWVTVTEPQREDQFRIQPEIEAMTTAAIRKALS